MQYPVEKIKLWQIFPGGCKDSTEISINIVASPQIKMIDSIKVCIDTLYTISPQINQAPGSLASISWTPFIIFK